MKKNLKKIEPSSCPVTFCLRLVGGKWKILIIHLILNGINRFGKLQRFIVGISKQMLTNQLRELERDGILERKIYAEIPPHVEYFLTDLGKSLIPIIEKMKEWGENHKNC